MLDGYKILVVEDNSLNQKIATMLLERQGASVTIMDNGEEAIKCLNGNLFDFILMDLQMPLMDGYETTTYIRGVLKSDIPIIALSASDFDYDKERCKGVGMDDCISKPINIQKLHEVLMNISKMKNIAIGKACQ